MLEFIQKLGLEAKQSQRMAYDLREVPEDRPIQGYMIENHDISFEAPEEHPQFGPIGRVDCRHSASAYFSPEENKKLYNKLKRKFGMTREERDKKNSWF